MSGGWRERGGHETTVYRQPEGCEVGTPLFCQANEGSPTKHASQPSRPSLYACRTFSESARVRSMRASATLCTSGPPLRGLNRSVWPGGHAAAPACLARHPSSSSVSLAWRACSRSHLRPRNQAAKAHAALPSCTLLWALRRGASPTCTCPPPASPLQVRCRGHCQGGTSQAGTFSLCVVFNSPRDVTGGHVCGS